MTTLLQINSSIFSDSGQSTRLSDQFVSLWRARVAGAVVIKRDFVRDPVPHLTAERFQAFLTKPEERSAAQQADVAYSDRLIDELKRADVIVLGLPMYNFGVPSMLRAYFDHVARAGLTFRYTGTGPEGLLRGKKAYLFATRGGKYAGTPSDSETAYVKQFLRFLGIEDTVFVYAEGLALGDPQKANALNDASTRIERLAEIAQMAA